MSILNTLGLMPPRSPNPSNQNELALGKVTLINPGHDRVSDAGLRVTDGIIAELTNNGAGAGSVHPEFEGCFVLPGLIDMHVHLPPRNALPLTEHAMLLYLAHGVTGIREAGDIDGTAVETAKRADASRKFPCVRVAYCGPFVGGGKPVFRNTILISDPAEAEAAAIKVRETGATFMKLHDGLSEPMIRALEQACARAGLRIMGHVPAAMSYEEARIEEVQHFYGVPEPHSLERAAFINRSCDWHDVDEKRMDFIVETTLRNNIANTPTIAANKGTLNYLDFSEALQRPAARLMPPFYTDVIWHPEHGQMNARVARDYVERQVTAAIRKKQRLARKLFEAGARLYLGTDVGQPFVVPGLSLQEEMALFVEAGIPLEAVWRMATRDAGERLAVAGLGTIQRGAPADLLVFRADPTASLNNLSSLIAVIAAGRLYRKQDLDRAVAAQTAYFRSPLIKPLSKRGAKRALAGAIVRGPN